MLPPAQPRFGPYEVVGLLGAGGMGVVYRARDPRLGREVAIKALPEELSKDPKRLERFGREVRALGALSHPNILSVHDVGSENGAPYVVFELLEGETLRERLAGGPLPVRTAVDFAMQMARGLGAAHRQGIVHRDLKPENLFLARGGAVKILDFGLAKSLGPEEGSRPAGETESWATEPGARLGTAAYMSPEQARGQAVDARSDLFSLGVVIHEMLSGASAFRRETSAETVVAILKEPPPPLPPTPEAPGLGAVVARCLSKEPDERFQTAPDLEFALQQILGSGGTTWSMAKSGRPWRALAALVALGLAAVVGLFVGRQSGREPPAFRKLTARPGAVASARFSSDGTTVLFSGRWSGGRLETLEHRLDALEPRSVALPAGRIVGLAAGEAAILVPTSARSGTLLRVPLQGGAARTVAEGVATADWARDGSAFAIVRVEDGFDRLEYPPGRTLYRTPGTLLDIRISPDGRMVGLLENPVRGHLQARVGVVGDTGDVRFLTAGEDMMRVIVWSPDGREIWASDYHERARSEPGLSLLAASLSGRQRLLLRLPIDFRVLDVGPQGQALLAVDHIRWEAAGRLAGDDRERDLRFRDRTFVMDVSPDGRTILFTDRDPRVGRLAAFLQRAGEPQPVRLDVGEPQSLSPDGSRLTLFDYDTDTLRVIPVGAGEAFTPSRGTIAHYFNSRWLPDGRRILIAAQEKDRPKRLFVQEVPAGLPRPVTPEGVINMYPAISPDGKWVAAGLEQDGALQAAWPLDGGESRPLRGLLPGDWVVRWSQDGRFVYSYEVGRVQPPWPIHRVDLVTGRREVWKEVSPPGPSGALILSRIHLTPDGRSYGYTFRHLQSELYLVSGLR